ncbi:HDOD domain-containing protein [Marinobacter sp.]|uniref:HDOD domain-containing protein n=1 Tax=Marinobacter sp. TaxID=50741 RepID=UPI00384BD407
MQILHDIQLPILPEVTLRVLGACQQEDSYRKISDIICTDTALVARVLSLANSSLYGRPGEIRSIEQALLRLGTDRIRTLILTVALRQLLFDLGADQWQQLRDFWRHSLTTALTARALATLTRYPSADEAFMLGMVHNVGELIALKIAPGESQQEYLNDQAEIGARFAIAWGLGPMAADAMRYQQEPPASIRDAAHLVKLINLSTRLALADASGVAAAGTIFGLGEDLTREICARINNEVATLAESLGVSLEEDYDGHRANQALQKMVIHHAMTEQSLSYHGEHESTQAMLAATVSNLTLLTGQPALFFAAGPESLRLMSSSQGDCPEMSVSCAPALSVLTRSHRDTAAVHADPDELSVLDRQILGLLNTSTMLAMPVTEGDSCSGVFMLGLEAGDSTAAEELASMFCQQLSRLAAQRSNTGKGGDSITEAIHAENIRRQIHEISNPLTIIRQYIYQLRARLEDRGVKEELDVIRDELERAGNLLLQLGEGEAPEKEHQSQAILNDEIKALNDLFEDSLFRDHRVTCTLALSSGDTRILSSRAPVRQVLINLIRNAIESMEDGGRINLSTATPVWQNGRRWVELVVEDNGPGLPQSVQKRLFLPVKSDKGAGHSGLGLSIVKQLVDDMDGIIGCHTSGKGTRFRILLPAASEHVEGQ